ncbi:MAG: hypothetical protein JW719_04025 [Pirellulales bacterium]|nr:hypothetical protein [Pirellulales bacterium]
MISKSAGSPNEAPLLPWMRFVLRLAGTFNLLAGAAMILFYHEGFKLLGVPKPALILPVQVMGILVALFGVGYHCVAARPVQNRDLLLLGLLSKAISAAAALVYVVGGSLPWHFALTVLLADVIYVPPFWIIWRRLVRLGRSEDQP